MISYLKIDLVAKFTTYNFDQRFQTCDTRTLRDTWEIWRVYKSLSLLIWMPKN